MPGCNVGERSQTKPKSSCEEKGIVCGPLDNAVDDDVSCAYYVGEIGHSSLLELGVDADLGFTRARTPRIFEPVQDTFLIL